MTELRTFIPRICIVETLVANDFVAVLVAVLMVGRVRLSARSEDVSEVNVLRCVCDGRRRQHWRLLLGRVRWRRDVRRRERAGWVAAIVTAEWTGLS